MKNFANGQHLAKLICRAGCPVFFDSRGSITLLLYDILEILLCAGVVCVIDMLHVMKSIQLG